MNSSCDRFMNVFISVIGRGILSELSGALPAHTRPFTYLYHLAPTPLSRYVTVNTVGNLETVIIMQLIANLTANNASQLSTPVKCSDCLSRIIDDGRDMVCM